MATSPYPFAAAPDIVRSHQKDAYFTGHLSTTLTDLHLRLFGARSAHSHAPELRTLAALAYFCLTTLPGNRTLGEEYCDLVQIDGSSSPSVAGSLPTLRARAAYIAGTILLPYLVGRSLPSLRSKIRALLDRRLAHLRRRGQSASREARLWTYLSTHLASMTSASAGASLQALTLALFYCTGTYYELAKRLLSLRYVFTRSVPDSPDRAGYELLGILLAVQIAVQGYLHVREALRSTLSPSGLAGDDTRDATTAFDVAATTHTPLRGLPRFHLEDDKTMAYIKGSQQRRCTLCLEDMKDPAATQCGHVFCWECIGDWVREKPECPLCRREAMVQHILPLRVI